MEDVPPGYVAVGRVLGAWGLRGDLTVERVGGREVLSRGRTVTVGGQEIVIERSRGHGRVLHIKLAGVDTRESAAAPRGALLQLPERDLEPLPEGEYYRFQLIGLRVSSSDGQDLGRVTDVLSTAANDVLVIAGPLGELLIPAVDEVVQRVDLDSGTIIIDIIPGLLP